MNQIIFQKFIYREDIRKNRNRMYVFGDNLKEIGYGGQAKEMRGEYNTIGIPTKKAPFEYLNDDDYDKVIPLIKTQFDIIEGHLQCGHTIIIPSAGVGTGLADLPNKAPKIWKVVKEHLEKLGWKESNDN